MRKHFLILMLLTLLPLAGWATETPTGRLLVNSNVAVASVEYNGDQLDLNSVVPVVTVDGTPLTRDADYTWDGKYYTTEACTTEVTPKDADTYWVKVVGMGTYNGTAVTSFAVQPAKLTLKYCKSDNTELTYIVKKYGDANPAFNKDGNKLTVTGLKHGDSQPNVIDFSGAGYTQTKTNANVSYNATSGTGYALTWTGITLKSTNYTIVEPTTKMLIQKISLQNDEDADTKLSIVKVTAPSEYTGNNQAEPVYTVKWGDVTLNKSDNTDRNNKDYNVTYKKGGSAVEANAIRNAGDYVVTITGQNNYEGEVTADDYNFTIAKANLYVGVENISKPYRGKKYENSDLAEDIEWYFDGLKAGDAESIVTKTVALDLQEGAEAKNAGEYTLKVTASTSNSNYNTAVAENGKFTITPVSGLTITANKATKVYGPVNETTNPIKYWNADEDGNWQLNNEGETFTVTGAVKDEESNIDENTYATFKDGITVTVDLTKKDADTYTGGVTLTYKDVTTDVEDQPETQGLQLLEALKNYKDITLNGNVYEITPAPLRFTPKSISKTYGEADSKVVTWDAEVDADAVRVRGFLYDDDASIITTYPKLKRTNAAENADEYELVAYDAVLNSKNYEAKYETGKFIINKKALKVTATDQTFVVGTTTLKTNAYTIDTQNGLVNGDQANKVFSLKLATGVTSAKYKNTSNEDVAAFVSNKFTGVPYDAAESNNTGWENGVFAGGIEIVAYTGNDSKAANYDFETVANFTKGKVIVLASDGPLLIDDSQTNAITAIHEANGQQKSVTFTARTLNAEKWNAMVLPFAISMSDLCYAFNEYVVVDVLNNTTDGNAHFKINLDDIPANTPFLIMTKTAKNMNAITFTNKTIQYVTDDDVTDALADDDDDNDDLEADQLDGNGNPYVETDGGVKFVGVYKQQSFYGREDIKYMSAGQFYTAKNYTKTNPLVQKVLRAYLDMSGVANAAPMIFIENPDGTTTAISAINNDNIVDNYTKDGWFTANGIKLNDMPTEKGVYIHNGKKVVIK